MTIASSRASLRIDSIPSVPASISGMSVLAEPPKIFWAVAARSVLFSSWLSALATIKNCSSVVLPWRSSIVRPIASSAWTASPDPAAALASIMFIATTPPSMSAIDAPDNEAACESSESASTDMFVR